MGPPSARPSTPRPRRAIIAAEMPISADAAARRLRGGRVDDPGDFPEDAYEHMSPAERMAAVIRLSRRLFATKLFSNDGERRHPGLPDRLVGGRR